MLTATAATPPRLLPAGEYRADQIEVGAHVLYGSRDVGRVNRIEEMVAIHPGMVEGIRSGFLDGPALNGQPVLKFELVCSGGRIYYFARFPHEPVNVVEV